MSIFSKKSAGSSRNAARKALLRQRQLRLEPLESRRLFAGDAMHSMDSDHSAHASSVTVTDTAVIAHWDKVPRFGANPTNVAVMDGLWSDAATWSDGDIPAKDDIVSIPTGVSVVYDVYSQVKLDAIEVSGQLSFATDVDTSLWLNELMVMPSGTLTIGTSEDPVSAAVSAEIVITDTPGVDGMHYKTGTVEQPGIDPQQWGNGLIGFGTIEVHGQEKTASYIRLAQEPLAGDRVLVLESEPLNWRPGDELVLPDTQSDWNRTRVEELIIESVDGNRVTLTQPLAHSHLGPRSSAGGDPLVLPHIGNLSRNVVVRSENPDGVRGHVAFLAKADVEVSYARFKDLGRTTTAQLDDTQLTASGEVTHIGGNQQARYAMHFHHVIGPNNPEDTGYQFEVTGNAVDGALRWGIVVHGSHYGLIKDNFVYDYQGAGFVTENGQETYNHFEGNFAVLSNGNAKFKAGNGGEGFWFRSPLTRAVNNVSANSDRAGFNYYVQNLHGTNRDVWVKSAFRGADLSTDAEVIRYNAFKAPILQFDSNEVYASAAVYDSWVTIPEEKQFVTNLRGWNTSDNEFSLSSYDNKNLVVDGLTLIGDVTRLDPKKGQQHQPISRVGIEAVRHSHNINILNSEIRGVQTGIETPARSAGEMVVADSIIQAYVGIRVGAMTGGAKPETSSDYGRLVVENTRFERMPENLVHPDQYAIHMQFGSNTDVTKTNEVFLYDFNGMPGANYRVYYPEQAPNFIVPQTSSGVIGSPVAGLTNAQTWSRYGIAIGGAVAPTQEIDGDDGEAAMARGRALGIYGLVFPLTGDANVNQPPVVSAGSDFTVEQYRQVQLSGKVSDDDRPTGAAGGITHIDWSKQGGPGEVFFVNRESRNTLATFTEPGTYTLRLTASDGLRESYNDIKVTVLVASNRAPFVNAGGHIILNDSNITKLHGTASDDGNPYGIVETQWSMVSGPGTVKFADPHSPTTEAMFTAKGTYVLELRASDGELVTSGFTEVTVNVAFPQSPLLARLEMNGGQAVDSSVHDLHAEAFGTTVSDGKFGTALHFDGQSHITMPNTDFLKPSDGLTAALWVRPSVADGVQRPVLVWDGGSWDAYRIHLTNSPTSAVLNVGVATKGNQSIRVSTAPLPLNEWTHLALTYSQENGGEIRLYRDGTLIGANQGIGGPLAYKGGAGKHLTIGNENPLSTAPGFIGAMDDLHVYDYALSPHELSHLMMGHSPHAPTLVPPHHPVPHMHGMMSGAESGHLNPDEDEVAADRVHTLMAHASDAHDSGEADDWDCEDHTLHAEHARSDEASDAWQTNIDALLSSDLQLGDWMLIV